MKASCCWLLSLLFIVLLGFVQADVGVKTVEDDIEACEEGKKVDLVTEAKLVAERDVCYEELDFLKPHEDEHWRLRMHRKDLMMKCYRELTKCNLENTELVAEKKKRGDSQESEEEIVQALRKLDAMAAAMPDVPVLAERVAKTAQRDSRGGSLPENLEFTLQYCESVRICIYIHLHFYIFIKPERNIGNASTRDQILKTSLGAWRVVLVVCGR